jgi:hypothetical protein
MMKFKDSLETSGKAPKTVYDRNGREEEGEGEGDHHTPCATLVREVALQ